MKLLIIPAVFLMLLSCQPEPDTNKLYDELVVSTNFDPEADFGSYQTFAMPTDTVALVSETSDQKIITSSDSDFPRPVLDEIRFNLTSRGYDKVDKSEDPDLGINVTVVNDFNLFQQVVYPDPYGYPGGYYSGYYGYNSWYYRPYVNTYAYNTGALVIEIIDLKNRTPDNKVRVIWTAYMGDLYSTIELMPQVNRAIKQAFNQSSYIQTQGGT